MSRYYQGARRGGRAGRKRKCRGPPELTAYVLDFCPPNPEDRHREHREHDFLQLIGDTYFTLMEALPREDAEIAIGSRVWLLGPNSAIVECSTIIIGYDDLSPYAKSKLEEVVENIVREKEKVFVEFFNTAPPVNIRFHTLELLPGIGKKTAMKIIEEREREPFKSFDDIKRRVKIDPVKVITNRIIRELKGDERYYLFVNPPPWIRRGRRDIVVFNLLEKLYEKVGSSETSTGRTEAATRMDKEGTEEAGSASQA